MKAFRLALQFLTVFRMQTGEQYEAADFARSRQWFFAIGLLIGAIQFGLALSGLAFRMPAELMAPLVVTVGILATGGLHLDGVADTADGFGAGRDRESVLRIMKDERIGVFAVAAIVLDLHIKIVVSRSLLERHNSLAFLLAPLLSRAVVACVACSFPCARITGIGKPFSEKSKRVRPFLSLAAACAITALPDIPGGRAACLAAVFAPAVFLTYAYHKIKGYTGDVLGCVCEISEIAALAGFLIAWNSKP